MAGPRQRLDKWLWYARVAKTRSRAQKLIAEGRVRLNREKTTTVSRPVRIGDVLTIGLGRRVLVLRIEDLGKRRGPAAEAQGLYTDLSPPPLPPPLPAEPGRRDAGTGRPTKRDRRRIDRLRDAVDKDLLP